MLRATLGFWLLACLSIQDQREGPLVFETGVDLVALDVSVVDASGRPVSNLGPADFTLSVDGSARRVVSVEFISQTGGHEAPAPAPLHFSSNEESPAGRLVLLAIDQGNIAVGRGRDVIDAARRLLTRLGPADRVGLLTLPGPEPRVEFTTDHEQVRLALNRVAGTARFAGRSVSLVEALAFQENQSDERWLAALERECEPTDFVCADLLEAEADAATTQYRQQASASLGTLASAFEVLKKVTGPKTMVLVSQGLGLPSAGPLAERAQWDLRPLAAAAAAARVSLFVVKVDPGLLTDIGANLAPELLEGDPRIHGEGLESLAHLARGAVLRGSPEQAFDRLARELSGYYLVGFEPEEQDRDGKDHDVKVLVSRRDVTVRGRRAVNIPQAGSGSPGERALAGLLRSPVLATRLPIRVSTFALRDAQSVKVRVLISAEIGRDQTPAGLGVGFVLVDSKGKLAAQGVQSTRKDAALPAGPVRYVTSAVVEPGEYTLRLAARDQNGRLGSVEHPVKAALTSVGRLQVSDLLVGLPPAGGAAFHPEVDLYVAGGTLAAHLELYGDPSQLELASVRVEVASRADGAPLESALARLATPSGGRCGAQATVALGGLPPGDYVARAVVSIGGAPAGGMTQPFRLGASPQ